ncbi:hypothetical protein DER44DRAFT_11404 [Fusarium oxysporum]|nr:hypothetical protein DER44DRAFT_11404 [Fusarium oxysporum]
MTFAFLLALVYGSPWQATIQFLSHSLDSDLPLFLGTPASRITVNLSWSDVSCRVSCVREPEGEAAFPRCWASAAVGITSSQAGLLCEKFWLR